jgi:hypothetical protein
MGSSSEDRHRDHTAADGPVQTSEPHVVCRRYWAGSCFWELASGKERPALGAVGPARFRVNVALVLRPKGRDS